MKKLTPSANGLCFGSLSMVGVIVALLWLVGPLFAAEFFCSSGNVTCLIAAINDANAVKGEHVINLEPGSYTLQIVDNMTDGPNGLPSIRQSIQIVGSAEDLPTVIERDVAASGFRLFHVSPGAKLRLKRLIVQRGFARPGGAIVNRGTTSIQDSVITNSAGEAGAVHNLATLNVVSSIIADNFGDHEGGGIHNKGNALVEKSTIAHNSAANGGGVFNLSSLIIRNSAIIFNNTDNLQDGGGIFNLGGSVEITNSTLAKNVAGQDGGGGISNVGGQVSIINSTIRENHAGGFLNSFGAGGITNQANGSLKLQNTIVAGNTFLGSFAGPDCFGTISSIGNNLIGDPSGCTINFQPNDLIGDPGLDSLVGAGEEDLPGEAFYPVLEGNRVINNANSAACFKTDQIGNPRVGRCDIGAIEFQERLLVSIDIRPHSDSDEINPNSPKGINVAILSLNGFDATIVRPNSVRFGATGVEAAPINVVRNDVDGDGNRDMFLRFQIRATGLECGDTAISLTGETSNGVAFKGSTPISTLCK
jgi:hypothetical protein